MRQRARSSSETPVLIGRRMRALLVFAAMTLLSACGADDPPPHGCVTTAASDPDCIARSAERPRVVVCSWSLTTLEPRPDAACKEYQSVADTTVGGQSRRETHYCCPPEK